MRALELLGRLTFELQGIRVSAHLPIKQPRPNVPFGTGGRSMDYAAGALRAPLRILVDLVN